MSYSIHRLMSMKEHILRVLDSHTSARIITEPDSECLIWTGPVNHRGVPTTRVQPTKEKKYPIKSAPLHTWELVHGKLEGDRLRNTCGTKLCVNPHHYEPYSKRCANGHEWTPEITKTWTAHTINAKGERVPYPHKACRVCIDEFPRKSKVK